MKPIFYLHIGRPKTGSTALQRFLVGNAPRLIEHGFFFPETGRYQKASHKFAQAYRSEAQSEASELWYQLEREHQATEASNVILSSENFWFIDPEKLPRALEDMFDVRIVAYLRRQDDVLVSSFCEEVKGGWISLDADIGTYATESRRLELLDYHSVLSRWGDRFGDSQVFVRVYESLPEGGIAADFLDLVGLSPDEFAIEPVPVNPSLPYDVLQLLSNVGELPLGQMPRRQFVTALSEASSTLSWDPCFDSAGLFAPEVRNAVMENFRHSNDLVRSRFHCSVEGELFPDAGAQAPGQPRADLDPARISALLFAMSLIQERKFHRLGRRIKHLEDEFARLIEVAGSVDKD